MVLELSATLVWSVIVTLLTLIGGLWLKAYIDPVKREVQILNEKHEGSKEEITKLDVKVEAQALDLVESKQELKFLAENVGKLCDRLDKYFESKLKD